MDGDYDDEGDIPPNDLNADGDTLDVDKGYSSLQKEHFLGVAPEAGLLSVKVGDSNGSTDVSQVLAAIDWVIQHKNDAELGLNIRVLNLSYGTDGLQSYLLDPLTYAVETAWKNGIVVVAAAGNEGFGSTRLNNPAYDPFIIAVGADDTKGTNSYSDDRIPDFSARGNYFRHPDFVAPGKGILSLSVPGSRLAEMNPQAVFGTTGRFLRGSGTSQAAAMVSGAAALLIQERPELTPDQVKQLLIETAHPLEYADEVAQGAGLLKVSAASSLPAPTTVQSFKPATGMGSLQASRGTDSVIDDDGTPLVGEVDIFGQIWDPSTWSSASANLNSWVGGDWLGRTWSGSGWLGRTWSSTDWSASNTSWSGRTWSGRTWSGRTWSGSEWGGDGGWTDNGGISKSVFFGRTWSSVNWQ
jgi:serine protease AprX